nr:reverse transcriptase domain-containing protein [Tanacetum cinerariifolium]
IIMVNIIPLDNVDDLPVVEPNKHDDVLVVPEPVLVDEDEDPKEEEFEKEEEPQEEEDDMEFDIEEDDNKPKLTSPYEEVDPLNPPLTSFELEPEDVIEVEDTVESEDESSCYRMTSLSRRLCGCEMAMHWSKRKEKQRTIIMLSNAEEKKAECKKLKKELEEARFTNTLLHMQNELVERDLYWTRVRAHEFYREMIRKGFVFEERPNKAIDVSVEDKKSPSSKPRGFPQSVNAAIAAERARHANAGNDVRRSGLVRGQDAIPVTRECTFDGFMKCNPIVFKSCQIIKMNNQKQENTRAMTTALTEKKVSSGTLPVCECCFTLHNGLCMIKCHKCGKVRNKSRYCKEKSVATGANAQPVWTCYDCVKQGHTRNRCPKKVKQEENEEVRGQAYAIKDVELQGLNVVTGTFLLNNRYASILFDSGFDRNFVDNRFSSMLDIDPVKIDASYKVELADGRVVSTNIVLNGCTLELVNYLLEIDLMPIELSTFDDIIGMDWLVKHDAVIIYGEKVVRIPYGNKTLTVESDKGMSRLKVISCIKAHKYIERGCHLFLVHVPEKKPKDKQLEDVPVIRDFPEVFPHDLSGLPPPTQVEF